MRYALHAGSIRHTNVVTDIVVAREAGYDGIELQIPKLSRYLDNGYTTQELARHLGPLRVVMLDALLPIELVGTDDGELLAECGRYARVAADLSCNAIQVVALDNFDTHDPDAVERVLMDSLNALADKAFKHGVRLAIEPVVFSRFSSLERAVNVVAQVGTERVGLCLDTWHLWTTQTPWSSVATLSPDSIAAVQLSDTLAKTGTAWRDEDRAALPGDGILPLHQAMRAISATGYDGMWSVEMLSPRHWEWEPGKLARTLKDRVTQLSQEVGAD